MSNIKLYNGDCLKLMKNIEDNSVDMILCDLPFGKTANKWDKIIDFKELATQYKRIIKNNGVILLFGTEPFSSQLRLNLGLNYKYDWTWIKNVSTNFHHAKRMPLRKSEQISVFYDKQPTYNPQKTSGHEPTRKSVGSKNGKNYHGESKHNYEGGSTERYPDNILYFNSVNQYARVHPNEKPIELCEYLIKTYTTEGMMVLDNCMGSGVVGVACKNLNRDFIGIELGEDYFKIAENRILRGVNE